LTADRVIAGFGKFDFVNPNAAALRLDLPRQCGFDVFVNALEPEQDYMLAFVDFSTKRATVLTDLPHRTSAQELEPQVP